jgi:hypothetical protein
MLDAGAAPALCASSCVRAIHLVTVSTAAVASQGWSLTEASPKATASHHEAPVAGDMVTANGWLRTGNAAEK